MDSAARFDAEGYLVRRALVDPSICAALMERFVRDIKPSTARFQRQATSRPEAHNTSRDGHVTNPLLNLQSLCTDQYGAFVEAFEAAVSSQGLQSELRSLLGADPVAVQSMYFEGSRGNDVHCDTHFIDAHPAPGLIGAWVALETIPTEAGRFFVYPRSHRLDVDFGPEVAASYRDFDKQASAVVGAYTGDKVPSVSAAARARVALQTLIERAELEQETPALSAGDVVFFSSRTLHGSHRPARPAPTRHSMTAHFIAHGAQLSRRGAPAEPLDIRRSHGAWIHQPPPGVV